jgi:DNA modification methylase
MAGHPAREALAVTARILVGDALAMLRTLPSASVQVCVTSPPYFGLRDYGASGQMGLEQTPADFIANLVAVFDEVKRVLRPDGLCFVNLGDSYAGSGKGPTGANGIGDQEQRQGFTGGRGATSLFVAPGDEPEFYNAQQRTPSVSNIPAKNLLLIPERFAVAMQDAGWVVRSRIAWCKKSSMPESVRDRPTSAWEHIWMFSKSARYFYDAEAVRQPHAEPARGNGKVESGTPHTRGGTIERGPTWVPAVREYNPAGANLRNFWLLGPEPLRESHYAAFPTEIPRRCILAGSRRGDTVLDPFLGSGTTALVADQLGRDAIGIELSPKYAAMAEQRIAGDCPMFTDVAVIHGTTRDMMALL